MAQESTALNTQNSTGGLFGGLLSGLGNLITSAAPVAANLYTLRMQGDVLKSQLASQPSAAATPAASSNAGSGAMTPSWLKPWMIWAGVGVAAIALFGIVRRVLR